MAGVPQTKPGFAKNRVFATLINTLFGASVVCIPESRGSRRLRFPFPCSANPTLNSLFVAVWVVFERGRTRKKHGKLPPTPDILGFPKVRERKTHKHNQICEIVPGLGGWRKSIYVLFWGHCLWGRKNTYTKSPPKSRENQVNCLFIYLVAWLARIDSHDSRESGDSRESEIQVIRANRLMRYKNRGFSCEWFARSARIALRIARATKFIYIYTHMRESPSGIMWQFRVFPR